MSGEEKHTPSEYTAGVAIVINNKLLKYLKDIITISDRMMILTLKATCEINIICLYIPQAMRPTEEKERVYKELHKNTNKYKNRGPLYVIGDWNAKIRRAQNKAERKHIGKWTFGR